ncbi:Planctomycete cytochrome C [Planctomycetales bacterium 10988]|nr:Planctomycete cytochrome C [Planctomycetales bacterium 10988]
MKYGNWHQLILCSFLGICVSSAFIYAEERIDFQTQIKPILSDRCFVCHGPDAAHREGDLRLDTPEGAFGESYGGIVPSIITPGDPDQSELVRRLEAEEDYEIMPPPESNLSVTAEEKELIRKWIAQGATWQKHWSFEKPTTQEPPPVQNPAWIRNEIDPFILSKLEAAHLEPTLEAPKEILARRLSFDLTGLPPSLEELDTFLSDESPQAYEHYVDRLLNSPHFGERLASFWLDAARYSDTYGYQVDRDRYVWPWRDWVIRAFNQNLPYDQFITWQLAGDLLPNPTRDQQLATAFNRLHPQKAEGGSIPEEFRNEYVSDRTQTFGTVFLGLTLECARCHDHKYDPISQKEYYQFSAYFNNIEEAGLYSFFTESIPTPTLLLPTKQEEKKLAEWKAKILQQETHLKTLADRQRIPFKQWLAKHRQSLLQQASTLNKDSNHKNNKDIDPSIEKLIPGLVDYHSFEKLPEGENNQVPGIQHQAIQFSGDTEYHLKTGNVQRSEPFTISFWMWTPDKKERAVILHRSRAWTDAGSRGYQILLEEGHLTASLVHFLPGNAIEIRTEEAFPLNTWQHVTLTYDGSSQASGLKFYMNGELASIEIVRDQLTKQITGGGKDTISLGARYRDRGFTNGKLDELYLFNRELSPIEIQHLKEVPNQNSTSLIEALSQKTKSLSKKQRQLLKAYYLSAINPIVNSQLYQLQNSRQAYNQLFDGIDEIMTMKELSDRRVTYLLNRGAYNDHAEEVIATTPDVFQLENSDEVKDRLALAKWVTNAENPLTARVAVNHFWQLIFGDGLVRTPEDFGSQGQLPTHPQLLDHLAVSFQESGWNVKDLLKQMVMSATYRQSVHTDTNKLQQDPENKLWSRSSGHRLTAEMLRDNALAVSGLLVEKIGGPPAKPLEVEVSFKPVSADEGDGRHRRSLYTYWKQTGPAPVMMTFDASKREVCRVKRERTLSPLQSLVMLNDPQLVEASKALSRKIIAKQQNEEDSLRDIFRLLTSRQPSEREFSIVLRLYQTQKNYYHQHPQEAKVYLGLKAEKKQQSSDLQELSTLAALTVVSNTLFNFDDCVRRK